MGMDIARLSIAVDSTEMDAANKKMQTLAKSGMDLENVLKKVAGAFGVYQMAQFAKDATMAAARYETLGVVVNVVGNNAGYSSKQLEAFQKALQGTGISAMESRSTLATMAQAHIDLAQSADLARIAQDAAVIGGLNSSEAFQRMIYGIQSGQVEILRTIGLNVNFEQSYVKLAAQFGKNTKELTEAEKAQARANAVMEKGADIAGGYEGALGTVGKQFTSMKKYADNLQISIGDIFKPAFGTAVQAMTQGLKGMQEWVDRNKQEFDLMGSSIRTLLEQSLLFGKALGTIVSDAGEAANGFLFLRRTLQGIGGIIAVITDTITALRVGFFNVASEGAHMWQLQLRGMMDFLDAIPDWMIPGKQTVRAGLQLGYVNMDIASRYAARRADEISMNPLATEKWLDSLDQIDQVKPWKDRIKPPGGGGGNGSATGGKALYDWDREANAAAQYAEQVRLEKAEYLNDESLRRWKEQSEQMKRINSDMFGDMTDTLHNWSGEAKNALTDFITTGKMDFRGMIDAWIMDLARLAAQQGLKDLAGSMGGSGSSWLSSLGSWFGGAFADGGSPPLGKVSLVGERGPELFVPKTPGTIVPAGGLGGNQTSITVNISGDKTDTKAATTYGPTAARELEAMFNEWAMKQQRQGGLFAARA